MTERVHYQPTEARTMCGLLVVPSMVTIGDLNDFFAHYSSGAETHCPRCVRAMRRWALYNEHFRVHNRIRARRIFPDPIT